ncbi:hypothetical protein LMG29542_07709 [Paraburkholderia humisilvae]|uniref:Uncharacterized protein n=1 Tax=Paraburkholderia humisilvae TaxID=627669 RepID=A0A6J5F758_9BURK|nr:hypothetical protein LMG29542_07709 [Paraburkholderia humisilvae]
MTSIRSSSFRSAHRFEPRQVSSHFPRARRRVRPGTKTRLRGIVFTSPAPKQVRAYVGIECPACINTHGCKQGLKSLLVVPVGASFAPGLMHITRRATKSFRLSCMGRPTDLALDTCFFDLRRTARARDCATFVVRHLLRHPHAAPTLVASRHFPTADIRFPFDFPLLRFPFGFPLLWGVCERTGAGTSDARLDHSPFLAAPFASTPEPSVFQPASFP